LPCSRSTSPSDPATGAIDQITLRKDGDILHELTEAENIALLTMHGMTTSLTRYDLVLDHDDLLSSAVLADGSRDINLTIKAAGSTSFVGTINAIVQRVGAPE
jgi:hypothetical protein